MGSQTNIDRAEAMAEKYSLNWATFSEHLQLVFKDLYQEGRYTDVTLVSDDQTQFKAHKIVLSACSPVFKKIIDSNPSQHSLIYLRGIQSNELESILQFMYLGEGRFYHERMREFIKVAQDLQVVGLSEGLEMELTEKEENLIKEETVGEDLFKEESVGEDLFKEESAEENVSKVEVVESLPEETKIGAEKRRTQISAEDGKSTLCPDCGLDYKYKADMMKHYRSRHEGVRYACSQCDYKATKQNNLQAHIRYKHQGVRYPCDQCEYQATQKIGLQCHIESKHSDIVLKCDLCDFSTKRRYLLKRHLKSHKTV